MSDDALRDEIARLERQLERQRALVQASYALHTTLDLDELLGLILTAARSGVRADRGTVFLVSEDREELWSRVLSGDEKLEIRLPLGQGIAGAVGKTGDTIRIDDAYEDDRFDQSWDKKTGYRTRQILCAPIRNRDGVVVGVFQLLNRAEGNFTGEHEEYLASLSIHASLAIENTYLHKSAIEKERFDREVRLAQQVQRQLQPAERHLDVGCIAVAGLNELCEDATGDYYDVLGDLSGDRVAIVLGDVSGHGLQAALVMAEARAYLRAFVRTADDLPSALNLLNDSLVPDMEGGKFMSMFAAIVDTKTGAVEWVNAGHNPPYIVRADGSLEELAATGRILGILMDAGYKAGAPLTLEPGDLLFVYTDGVTEARNPAGDLYGEERLETELKRIAGVSARDTLGDMRAALRDYTRGGANDDDITMLAVRRS